jgi:hypothetical protein
MRIARWFNARIFAIPLIARKFEKGTKDRPLRPLVSFRVARVGTFEGFLELGLPDAIPIRLAMDAATGLAA